MSQVVGRLDMSKVGYPCTENLVGMERRGSIQVNFPSSFTSSLSILPVIGLSSHLTWSNWESLSFYINDILFAELLVTRERLFVVSLSHTSHHKEFSTRYLLDVVLVDPTIHRLEIRNRTWTI